MTTQINNNRSKRKFTNYKKFDNMSYMEIIEEYNSYPSDKLKFSYIGKEAINYSEGQLYMGGKGSIQVKEDLKQSKFLSEQDKAEGWIQKFPKSRKFSQYLITNLHYLPEHLWEKMKPFYQDGIHVGYKVNDGSINFFVNCADTDEITKLLLDEIRKERKNLEVIKNLTLFLEEKGIDCWITIRARKCLNL